MNYSVHWTQLALKQLAAAWLVTADRNALTAASHRLEQSLALDPFGQGIARNASTNRTAIDLPLGIDFEIIEDDKKVRILRVWPVE